MSVILGETQQQIVDLAREFAAEHIAPFAAEMVTPALRVV